MPMTITQLDQQLRSGTWAPVYLLLGPEAFLRQSAVERIRGGLTANGDAVAAVRIDAGQTAAGTVMESAQSLGLFAARQLLIVGDIGRWGSADEAPLTAYCANPNPATTLVCWAEKLDQRTKLARLMTAAAAVVECRPLYANQVPEWVRIECQRQGRGISREAARLLADAVGTDLGIVRNAIDKVLLYTEGKPLIGIEDMEAVVLETSERSIFELCNAVGSGQRLQALQLLDRLVGHGEPPVVMLAMLARHWRLLCRARAWLNAGERGEAASVLKVPPFFAKEYVHQAKGRTAEALAHGFAALAAADRQLKRSRLVPQTILTNTIMQLVSGPQG